MKAISNYLSTLWSTFKTELYETMRISCVNVFQELYCDDEYSGDVIKRDEFLQNSNFGICLDL